MILLIEKSILLDNQHIYVCFHKTTNRNPERSIRTRYYEGLKRRKRRRGIHPLIWVTNRF